MTTEMICKKCKIRDYNEIMILRKDKFTKKGKHFKDLDRVCWSCFKSLVRNGFYNCGSSWRGVILHYG